VKCVHGDEDDGLDETLIPIDFKTTGPILDDDVFDYLVAPLPQGCRLTAVVDCCHSGTMLDLPYIFVASRRNMAMNPTSFDGIPRMFTNVRFYVSKQQKSAKKMRKSIFAPTRQQQAIRSRGMGQYSLTNKKFCAAEVVSFSGCTDDQTSSDVANSSIFGLSAAFKTSKQAGGACTNAWLVAVQERPHITYIDLLDRMRAILEMRNFAQVPQLSSSRPLPMTTLFSLEHQQF
jgi:hypothetical protein